MKQVSIIGIGLTPDDLTEKHKALIHRAEILVGGKRLLDFFPESSAEKMVITKDLRGLIERIEEVAGIKSVVILASGDPLFFGIGQRIVEALGSEMVTIYPNISSVAAAFSRIKESWNDTEVISFHGRRGEQSLIKALGKSPKVAIYTDPNNDPAGIAACLIENKISNVEMCVLEQLGTPQERVRWIDLDSVQDLEISQPNLVILKRKPTAWKTDHQPFIGMPESWFYHQDGLITKSEIRAVVISKLQIYQGLILWDLGAGSGSVGIEASMILKDGKVYAVEKQQNRINQIMDNKQRFEVKNLEVVQADLPEGLKSLPDPDRVFIGGGGKKLDAIVEASAARMGSGGIIVVNTVLISNIDGVLDKLKKLRLKTDVVQVQINRGKTMPWGERLQAENPIWVISGERI